MGTKQLHIVDIHNASIRYRLHLMIIGCSNVLQLAFSRDASFFSFGGGCCGFPVTFTS